jgi:hypothetical protein
MAASIGPKSQYRSRMIDYASVRRTEAGGEILIRMPLARRDDWHQDVRGSGCLGKDAIAGDARLLPRPFRLAGIRVDVEMREIAARYVEPQAVPRQNKFARKAAIRTR